MQKFVTSLHCVVLHCVKGWLTCHKVHRGLLALNLNLGYNEIVKNYFFLTFIIYFLTFSFIVSKLQCSKKNLTNSCFLLTFHENGDYLNSMHQKDESQSHKRKIC